MKVLEGKPLIQYSIDFALNSLPKDSIWVNSDNKEILDFSKKIGINTFVRPDELATDFSSTLDVIQHQVKYFQSNNVECDAIIILQPTNPLRSKDILQSAIDKFETSERNSLATFSASEKKLGKIVNNRFKPTNYTPGQRSQDLKKSYYENGLLYITKIESILKGDIITKDVYPLICEDVESTVDIDYIEDFLFAETLLKIKNDKE